MLKITSSASFSQLPEKMDSVSNPLRSRFYFYSFHYLLFHSNNHMIDNSIKLNDKEREARLKERGEAKKAEIPMTLSLPLLSVFIFW